MWRPGNSYPAWRSVQSLDLCKFKIFQNSAPEQCRCVGNKRHIRTLHVSWPVTTSQQYDSAMSPMTIVNANMCPSLHMETCPGPMRVLKYQLNATSFNGQTGQALQEEYAHIQLLSLIEFRRVSAGCCSSHCNKCSSCSRPYLLAPSPKTAALCRKTLLDPAALQIGPNIIRTL